jgi:hypothetical protein
VGKINFENFKLNKVIHLISRVLRKQIKQELYIKQGLKKESGIFMQTLLLNLPPFEGWSNDHLLVDTFIFSFERHKAKD